MLPASAGPSEGSVLHPAGLTGISGDDGPQQVSEPAREEEETCCLLPEEGPAGELRERWMRLQQPDCSSGSGEPHSGSRDPPCQTCMPLHLFTPSGFLLALLVRLLPGKRGEYAVLFCFFVIFPFSFFLSPRLSVTRTAGPGACCLS